MQHSSRLISEAVKYYPDLKPIAFNLKQGDARVVSRDELKKIIAARKLREIKNWLATQHIAYKKSHSSKSFYFRRGGVDFRVSDHPQPGFIGEDILVNYKTDIVALIFNKIILRSLNIEYIYSPNTP